MYTVYHCVYIAHVHLNTPKYTYYDRAQLALSTLYHMSAMRYNAFCHLLTCSVLISILTRDTLPDLESAVRSTGLLRKDRLHSRSSPLPPPTDELHGKISTTYIYQYT